MNKINVKAERYSKEELKEIFSSFSEKDEDFDAFISAMQETGQLEEVEEGIFMPLNISKTKKIKARYETFETVLAGGKKNIPAPRAGIHALKSESRKIPVEARIIKYVDKEGNWREIPESPPLRPQRPRKHERWRMEIPTAIRKKYDIGLGQSVRIKVGRVSKKYFSRLRLWGYKIQGMVTFGQTGGHKADRELELHGFDFPYEVKTNIKTQMGIMGDKVLDVSKAWLRNYDGEYYDTFVSGGANQDETKSPEPIDGIGAEPLIRKPKISTKIQFRDLQKGRTIAKSSGQLPTNWDEMLPSDIIPLLGFDTDTIGNAHGYKGRKEKYKKLKTKQTTLSTLKKQKEGFK